MGRDISVGNTDGYPYCTFVPVFPFCVQAGSLANHLKDPCLILVGYGETLSAGAVTVFLNKRGHYLYCLAGSFGTLEGDVDK